MNSEKLSFVLGVERMNEKIKVVYSDGEPIVYRDDNRLNEKEIVDLLVEFFEDCDALIKENEELKNTHRSVILTEKQRFEYNYKTDRICDNESDFQCTSNMLHIVRRLNDFDEKCKKLSNENKQLKEENEKLCNFNLHKILDKKNKEIEQLKHELATAHGLYASDQEDMSEPFRLDFSKILQE